MIRQDMSDVNDVQKELFDTCLEEVLKENLEIFTHKDITSIRTFAKRFFAAEMKGQPVNADFRTLVKKITSVKKKDE